MSEPEHDPSIHAEPHLRKHSFTPEPSEAKAAQQLERERLRADADEERAKHSIFDEPAILPHRGRVVIDQDWHCRNCGYNLRGLLTGHPCPECGVIERYEPPRESEETYAKWVASRRGRIGSGRAWVLAVLVPLAAIPLAAGYALMAVEYAVVTFLVLAPVAAEAMKVAGASIVIERRSFWIQSRAQLYLMTILTAVLFAAVQNVVCLALFFPNPSAELLAWRWLGTPLLHALCTAVATSGLVTVWERTQQEERPPSVASAYPSIVTAILLHAAVNVCVFAGGWFGYGF